ncbi:MAG: biopolymer transporter ExbD [Planctomycetes bacterium]|nr:biopolymer transporter ExbD [Planctomycetota bacterium]
MKNERFKLDLPPPEEPGLLMTSMIDVIFILLAFFVCVSEVKKGKLTIDVPEVAVVDQGQAKPPAVPPIVIEVTGEDEVHVDGVLAESPAQIEQLLRESAASRGLDASEIPLYFSGDKDGSIGAMMRVMSRASKMGFGKIDIAVQPGRR